MAGTSPATRTPPRAATLLTPRPAV